MIDRIFSGILDELRTITSIFSSSFFIDSKKDNERSADKFREDNVNEKLTIGKIRRAAYKTGKVLGDVQAVKKGKVARRVKNRILGKMVGKALGSLWK